MSPTNASNAVPIILYQPGKVTVLVRAGDEWVSADKRSFDRELRRYHPAVRGKKKRTIEWAMEQTSSICDRVDATEWQLGQSGTGFERRGARHVLMRGCAPLVDCPPAHDRDVALWLRLLAGGDTRLLWWLVTSTDLTRPTSALQLWGEPGAGKGLLASAVARQWGTATTSFDDIAGTSFNSALRDNPVVVLDEGAGKNIDSAAFRSLVSERSRPLTEKYQPTGTLHGCVRLIIAANNANALRLGGDALTREDADAIGQRIFAVRAGEDARRFLAGCNTDDWVCDGSKPGRIPRHLAWLRSCHEPVRGDRWLVAGNAHGTVRKRVRGPHRDVLVALAIELSKSTFSDHLLVRGSTVLPRAAAVAAMAKVSPVHAGRALRVLSSGEQEKVAFPVGGRARCWPIDGQLIIDTADELGVGDADHLRALLAAG